MIKCKLCALCMYKELANRAKKETSFAEIYPFARKLRQSPWSDIVSNVIKADSVIDLIACLT